MTRPSSCLPAAMAALIDETDPACPCVAGTTTLVHRLAALHQGGMAIAQIVADYPGLRADQVEAAVAYAWLHPWTGTPFPRETIKQALRAGGLDGLWPDEEPEAAYGRDEEAWERAQEAAYAEQEVRRARALSGLTWDPAFLDLSDPDHPRLAAPSVDVATLSALYAGGASAAQIQKHWPAYSVEAIENALAYLKAQGLE